MLLYKYPNSDIFLFLSKKPCGALYKDGEKRYNESVVFFGGKRG